jgi:hypothetical protein
MAKPLVNREEGVDLVPRTETPVVEKLRLERGKS